MEETLPIVLAQNKQALKQFLLLSDTEKREWLLPTRGISSSDLQTYVMQLAESQG